MAISSQRMVTQYVTPTSLRYQVIYKNWYLSSGGNAIWVKEIPAQANRIKECPGLTESIHARFKPQYTFASSMPSSCKEIRQELIECMLKSDCVLVKRNTVAECMKEENAKDVPSECHSIRKSYAECRRGMVSLILFFYGNTKSCPLSKIDPRKRFRGNATQ